jgi:predicted nucleotidyltransferase
MISLPHHLFGTTRTAVLAAVLLRPDETRHVRELARMTGVSPGTLHRELVALASLGIVRRQNVGRQVFYSADRRCPIFTELAALLRKTAGAVDVLSTALKPLSKRIDAAFVYGSTAAGEDRHGSDVDVMILGRLKLAEAVKALAPAQQALQKDVNPTVMNVDEFARRRRTGDGFVASLASSPKLWIVGGERDIE